MDEVLLIIGPVYTEFKFVGMSSDIMCSARSIIRKVTSARPKGYKYMPRFKSGTWDGYIHLTNGNRFPSGLVDDVVASLAGYMNVNTFYKDGYRFVADGIDLSSINVLHGIELRDYQVQAVRGLLNNIRGVAKMATNSGKTAVIGAIAKLIPGDVLILTTKKDILYQTVDWLGMYLGESIGIVGDGKDDVQRVTVGMIQTLVSRTDDNIVQAWLNGLDCVMFDECHHLPSQTAQQIMYSIPAPYRFGFSGTPLSYDKLTDLILIGATGPVVTSIEVTNAQLIEAGISAKPVVYMEYIDDPDYWDEDYHFAYDACIVNNQTRNGNIFSFVTGKEWKSVLILVERVEHGKLLSGVIDGAVYVDGNNSMDERRNALDLLRQGNGSIIVATPVFDEGVDVPAVELLVLAGGGKGHKRLLQRIGRGMRRKEGDNVLMVLDFADDTNSYLSYHSDCRYEIYLQEGFEVLLDGDVITSP